MPTNNAYTLTAQKTFGLLLQLPHVQHNISTKWFLPEVQVLQFR